MYISFRKRLLYLREKKISLGQGRIYQRGDGAISPSLEPEKVTLSICGKFLRKQENKLPK